MPTSHLEKFKSSFVVFQFNLTKNHHLKTKHEITLSTKRVLSLDRVIQSVNLGWLSLFWKSGIFPMNRICFKTSHRIDSINNIYAKYAIFNHTTSIYNNKLEIIAFNNSFISISGYLEIATFFIASILSSLQVPLTLTQLLAFFYFPLC